MAAGGWLVPAPPERVMNRTRGLWLGLSALAVGACVWQTAPVHALSGQGVPGVSFSPVLNELKLGANQPTLQTQVTLKNRSSVDQTYALSVVDFGALDEQGGVAFLGEPSSELEHRYGLASWMKPSVSRVTIPAGSSVDITLTIENRRTLSPGGHYGAVLATEQSTPGTGVAAPRVGVKQVISSLVLLVKEGAGAPAVKLVRQNAESSWWKLPTKVSYRFHGSGNIHAVPRGVTELRDAGGNVVARAALNADSAAVFPGSYRRYEEQLMPISNAWLPGRYALVTNYRADGNETMNVMVSSVWYVGSLVVWAVMLVILVIVGLASWWLSRRLQRRAQLSKVRSAKASNRS